MSVCLPEQSSVCVWVPSLTFSDMLAAASPKNLSIVLTASWSVFTADRAYVSSASNQPGNTRNITCFMIIHFARRVYTVLSRRCCCSRVVSLSLVILWDDDEHHNYDCKEVETNKKKSHTQINMRTNVRWESQRAIINTMQNCWDWAWAPLHSNNKLNERYQ